MKNFLTVTALIEVGTSLGMLALPVLVAELLLGVSLTTPLESVMARVCGVALLALGVACWLARNNGQSSAARGLAGGILLYDVGAVAVLLYAALGMGLSGVLLWPVDLIHAALAVWCVVLLAQTPAQ